MKTRDILKELHIAKSEVLCQISLATADYIDELREDQRGIFISDHAIVRYLERVKGYTLAENVSDFEKINRFWQPPENIRAEMLSIQEDRKILKKGISFYRRHTYAYVLEGLTIVTVLNNDA